MKQIVMAACFAASCCYGMEVPTETTIASSADMSAVKGTDNSVKVEVGNGDLMAQLQEIVKAKPNGGDNKELLQQLLVLAQNGLDKKASNKDNVFETSQSTYKEGRFWTVVRKVFQPLQIVTSASTMALITASEIAKEPHPSVADGLSYAALGTSVASGVLSIFITKMNSKINRLNVEYKSKLASEKQVKDVELLPVDDEA